MAQGPDRLEIHIHLAPPPRRAGPSLGLLVFALVCWPLVLLGFVVWFVVTLVLTAAGILVLAGAGVVVAAGWLLGLLLRTRAARAWRSAAGSSPAPWAASIG